MSNENRIVIVNKIPSELKLLDLKSIASPFNGSVDTEIHREKDLLAPDAYALITFHSEEDADDFVAVLDGTSLVHGDEPVKVKKLSVYKEDVALKISQAKKNASYIHFKTSDDPTSVFCFMEPVSELIIIDDNVLQTELEGLSFPVKKVNTDFTSSLEYILLDGEIRFVALFKTDGTQTAQKVAEIVNGRSYKGRPIKFVYLLLS